MIRMRSLVFAAGGFLNPEDLIRRGGLLLLTAIIFAESGLFIGFFLPGDSLLFIAGFLSSDAGGHVLPALPIVLVCVFLAAFIGDQVGYLFGNRVGPALFARPDSRFFKQAHLAQGRGLLRPPRLQDDRAGPLRPDRAHLRPDRGRRQQDALPHVRRSSTSSAPSSGPSASRRSGYFLGQIDVVKDNIEIALVAIVLVSIIPMVIEFVRHRRQAKRRRRPWPSRHRPADPDAGRRRRRVAPP